ncbi:MAG: FmdB family zinc ribbon protein, partial [Candidatus Neomarinimicrobiota bacterium]
MPTYDYKCLNCGFTFEHFQSMTDQPVKECPKCGGKAKRLISGGTGLIFRGSGFYITDYKNKKSESVSKESTKKT